MSVAVALAIATPLVAGCQAEKPVPTPSTSSGPSISPEDLAAAQRFRTTSGLRADPSWIIFVANDPRSSQGRTEYGVPLLPEELAELDRRARNSDEIFDVVEAYGRRVPADFAGIFVDPAGSGSVVVLFARNAPLHEADLRRMISPSADLEVRAARWSLRELEAFNAAIRADELWFPTVDATYVRSQVIPQRNGIELQVSSANPAIAALAMKHFAADGWLDVISDGIGTWSGPTGTLIVRAVIKPGVVPERSYACDLHPDEPAAYQPSGVNVETTDNRECTFTGIGATGYLVELSVDRGSGRVVVGSARIKVEDGLTRVDVIVTK